MNVRSVILFIASLTLAACASSGVSKPDGAAGAVDTSDATTAKDSVAADVSSANDAAPQDVVDAGGDSSDGGTLDATADTAAPDTAAPDTAAPDTAAPDTAAPDTAPNDITAVDSAAPDSSTTDAQSPDTQSPDSQSPDTGFLGDGGCVPQQEVCDGLDNDCDGETDEDFSLQVGPGLSFKVGDSCDNPECPKGVIVCANLKYAWCSTCPQPIPKSVVLAGAGSKPSPLTAKGKFTAQPGALKGVTVYTGSATNQPEGSAVMALDVDADGDVDLVVADGETSVSLYTQTKPWTFQAQSLHTDVDGVRAVAAMPVVGGGVRLLMGGGGLWAYERDKAGAWVNTTTKIGLKLPLDVGPVSHILPADVDRDGLTDLVVSLFPCKLNAPGLLIFRARGDGTFVEQSKALGVDVKATLWGAMSSDYTGDGAADLLLLTESCPPMWGAGLYVAQPLGASGPALKLKEADGVFTEPTNATEFSPMGADVADVNGDGVLDYFLAEIELWNYKGKVNPLDLLDPWLYADQSNIFLLSQPNGSRARAGLHAGLWAPLSASGKTMVAWTPAWSDLDHDGYLDVLVSHAPHYDAWILNDLGGMRPVAWRNDGQGKFTDVSVDWGLPPKHAGRSLVLADLDGDGDQDLAVGGMATAPGLWRNDIVHGGADVHVRLKGTVSGLWGLGARVTLKTNQRTMVAEHSVRSVTQAMAEPKTHFALRAGEKPTQLSVIWPSGVAQTQSVSGGGQVLLTEPSVISLSTRYLKGGAGEVIVKWSAAGTQWKSCEVEAASKAGAWKSGATCVGGLCSRAWTASAAAGGSAAFRAVCDGVALRVWPKVDF